MRYKDFHGEVYDFHGMTIDQFDIEIDRLVVKGKVVQIITGNGRGILKDRLRELMSLYDFKILQTAHNDASFIVDFSNDASD